jgi:hypothetical protein
LELGVEDVNLAKAVLNERKLINVPLTLKYSVPHTASYGACSITYDQLLKETWVLQEDLYYCLELAGI